VFENFLDGTTRTYPSFFSHFGEIDLLEIYGKVAIVLFKTFIDAYTSREFLQNSSNFKETEKDNFTIRWYSNEDEQFISELMKSKLRKYTSNQIVENLNSSMVWNNQSNNTLNNPYPQNYYFNGNNNEYMSTNFNGQYSYYSAMTLTPKGREEFNGVMMSNSNSGGYPGSNYYGYEEDGKSFSGSSSDKYLLNGKYTCKFEIQIENDNEFQVARRLIGAKGCNMKKIVELCSRGRDGKMVPDAVKLRLRGRGSGYKEGPYNRESDEPLHLCISSKYQDKYKRACILVQELIINVYEEYKRFCDRCGKTPMNNLTVQKEESVSSRRNPGGLNGLNPLIKDNHYNYNYSNNMYVDN
jgi:hypothetical protein